jgi:hypothetical protein
MNSAYEGELEVYDGLTEELNGEGVTLSDIVDEYGEAEGNHLIRDGTLIDQRDHNISLRGSRLPEADMECQEFFDYSTSSVAGSFAKLAGTAAGPLGFGYAATASGGDPLLVSATGATAYLVKDSVDRSIGEIMKEVGKKLNSYEAAKQYRKTDIEYEDFELEAVSDPEFRELVENTDLENNLVELREMPKMPMMEVLTPSNDT